MIRPAAAPAAAGAEATSRRFAFTVTSRDPATRARTGRLETPHGSIETPAFLFCATKAAVKAVTPDAARAEGTQAILANTYHLMLQPGPEIVARMGGLHRFMGWDGPMLTDSGGFQIFSLGRGGGGDDEARPNAPATGRPKTNLVKITEEGAAFRSHIDGTPHLLTPERSIDIQRALGADLVVALDECPPAYLDHDATARSMALTHRWEARSLARFARDDDGRQALYGVVQGGVYPDLRRESAAFVSAQNFFGHAIGGCLPARQEDAPMYEVFAMATEGLDPSRPVHLLGIGGVRDIWEGAARGVDTFDCVHPTRVARHGGALVRGAAGFRLNLRNAGFRDDPAPIEEGCPCAACRRFSRAYLHHLVKAGEVTGLVLITLHNISFMNRLMAGVRAAIRDGRLRDEMKAWCGVSP
jgi:queuine tRNA-ribosyltransferase